MLQQSPYEISENLKNNQDNQQFVKIFLEKNGFNEVALDFSQNGETIADSLLTVKNQEELYDLDYVKFEGEKYTVTTLARLPFDITKTFPNAEKYLLSFGGMNGKQISKGLLKKCLESSENDKDSQELLDLRREYNGKNNQEKKDFLDSLEKKINDQAFSDLQEKAVEKLVVMNHTGQGSVSILPRKIILDQDGKVVCFELESGSYNNLFKLPKNELTELLNENELFNKSLDVKKLIKILTADRKQTVEDAEKEVKKGLQVLLELKEQESLIKGKKLDSPEFEVMKNMSRSFTGDEKIKKWLAELVDIVEKLPDEDIIDFQKLNEQKGVFQTAGQLCVKKDFENFIGNGKKTKEDIMKFMQDEILSKFFSDNNVKEIISQNNAIDTTKLKQQHLKPNHPCDVIFIDFTALWQAIKGTSEKAKCKIKEGRINMVGVSEEGKTNRFSPLNAEQSKKMIESLFGTLGIDKLIAGFAGLRKREESLKNKAGAEFDRLIAERVTESGHERSTKEEQKTGGKPGNTATPNSWFSCCNGKGGANASR